MANWPEELGMDALDLAYNSRVGSGQENKPSW